MLQLHKTQGKPASYYARLLSKNGNLLWKTPATQYKTRAGATNAMFSALDGFNEAAGIQDRSDAIRYMDHTTREPIWKVAKRRVRK